MKKILLSFCFFLFVGSVVIVSQSSAALLYSNDFDGNEQIGSGVSTSGFTNGSLADALTGFGNWSGKYFDNRSTGNPATMSELTITGLSTHTFINVDFILGFLESWDSSISNGSSAPDFLDFFIDGTKVASLTSNNATGSVEEYGGGTELYDDVQVNTNYFYDDTLVDMSTASFLNFAHTSSTFTLGIQASGAGWQGSTDEGWGIDDIQIEYDGVNSNNSVPEPATMILFGIGLLSVAGISRRKE